MSKKKEVMSEEELNNNPGSIIGHNSFDVWNFQRRFDLLDRL